MVGVILAKSLGALGASPALLGGSPTMTLSDLSE